jgi:hypothetical protein
MYTYKVIEDVADFESVDLDGLIDGSWEQLRKHFKFPKNLRKVAEKKAWFKGLIIRETAFDYTLCWVFSEDGHDISLNLGRVKGDTITYQIGLVRPDKNGSRAFMYGPDFAAAGKKIRAERGIKVIESRQFVEGTFRNFFKVRFAETETINKDDGTETFVGTEI